MHRSLPMVALAMVAAGATARGYSISATVPADETRRANHELERQLNTPGESVSMQALVRMRQKHARKRRRS